MFQRRETGENNCFDSSTVFPKEQPHALFALLISPTLGPYASAAVDDVASFIGPENIHSPSPQPLEDIGTGVTIRILSHGNHRVPGLHEIKPGQARRVARAVMRDFENRDRCEGREVRLLLGEITREEETRLTKREA